MEFQAVVMAAGHGSRMTDLTSKMPKALLPIANMPMIWYPINQLEKAGFEEAIVVVLKSAQADIQKALVEICHVKMRLDFVAIPDSEDWGTADTLRHIRDKVKTDLLVISCDLITDLSMHLLADLHRTYDASVTMLLAPSPDTSEMAVPGGGKAAKKIERDLVGLDENGSRLLFLASEADFEDTISVRRNFLKRHPYMRMRSKLMDGHLYLMKRWVLDVLATQPHISTIKGELIPYLVKKQFMQPRKKERNPMHHESLAAEEGVKQDIYSMVEEDPLMKLALQMSTYNDHSGDMDDCFHGDKVRCYAYIMDGGFCLRTNTLVTYCEANRQLPRQLAALTPDKERPLIHPAAIIPQRAQIGPDSLIDEGTTVAEKVTIKKSIIGKHCSIAEKVRITNCNIMNHVTIQEGCVLSGCVVSANVHINEKTELKDCLIGRGQTIIAMGKFTNEVIVDLDRMMQI